MDISRITKVILKNCQKIVKMTPLTVKMEFSKNVKSLHFLMVQGSLNPNITFLGEKLRLVAWKKNVSVIQDVSEPLIENWPFNWETLIIPILKTICVYLKPFSYSVSIKITNVSLCMYIKIKTLVNIQSHVSHSVISEMNPRLQPQHL